MRKITAKAKQIKRLMFAKNVHYPLLKFPNCENCGTDLSETPETHIGFGCLWRGKSPYTNQIVKSSEKPTIEQTFWVDFTYNESDFRQYTLEYFKLSAWEIKSWLYTNTNAYPFRILWTDYDDYLMQTFVATESEAKEIISEIEKASTWNEMQFFLEYYNFQMF